MANPRTRQGIGNARPNRFSTSSRDLSNPERPVAVAPAVDADVVVAVVTEVVVDAVIEVLVGAIVGVIVTIVVETTMRPKLVPLSISQIRVLSRAWGSKYLDLS